MIKFNCAKCGSCCRNISDKNSSLRGLPVLEWELKSLKKLNPNLKTEPIDVFYDKKSKLYFCLGYSLIKEPCVFLKNNQCSIHKNRPLICKAFPIAKHPVFLEKVPDLSCFSKCCNFDFKKFLESLGLSARKPYNISKEKLLEEYNKTFDGETMKASFMKDNALKSFSDVLEKLTELKLIDIKRIKNIKNKKVVSFFDFLKEINF